MTVLVDWWDFEMRIEASLKKEDSDGVENQSCGDPDEASGGDKLRTSSNVGPLKELESAHLHLGVLS